MTVNLKYALWPEPPAATMVPSLCRTAAPLGPQFGSDCRYHDSDRRAEWCVNLKFTGVSDSEGLESCNPSTKEP